MNKQTMWILVILALIIGAFGGYYYEKSKLTNQMMVAQSAMEKQLEDAKMKNDQLIKNQATGDAMMKDVTPQPTGAMMEK